MPDTPVSGLVVSETFISICIMALLNDNQGRTTFYNCFYHLLVKWQQNVKKSI